MKKLTRCCFLCLYDTGELLRKKEIYYYVNIKIFIFEIYSDCQKSRESLDD